jgi:DNA polymerase (family 10)
MLRETASLLIMQGANPFRAQAYHNAAELVDSLETPLSTLIAQRGSASLEEFPGIGKSLAKSLERIVRTGRLRLLEKLRSNTQPERILATVGGIGPVLARRLREELHITSLAELQRLLASGRLSRVPGFGEKRIAMIRESLSGRLRRPEDSDGQAPVPMTADSPQPSISILLDIDREYLNKARSGQLPRITPKQFNPTKEAWLPVLHTEREGQRYTTLFSNTPRAHSLGVTRDWVVIYRERRDGGGQWTVITSQVGPLQGRRVVRGREDECREYYQRHLGGEQPPAM